MAISDTKFGVHIVKWLDFGTGDIMFSPGVDSLGAKGHLLMFSQSEPGEIGREFPSLKGESSDKIPGIHVVFRFTDPKSITALIHSLIEVQEEMYKESGPQ